MAVVDNADWTVDVTAVAAGDMSDLPDWTWAEIGAGGGGGGGTTPPNFPTTLTGLVAWHDATQISGLADNSAVASWPAAFGHPGYDLAQATGASQPTYYKTTPARTVNSLPAVWFFGSQSMAVGGAASTAQPFTLLVVGGLSGISGPAAQVLSASGVGGAGWQAGSGQWQLSGTAGNNNIKAQTTGAHLLMGIWNGGSSLGGVDAVAAVAANGGSSAYAYQMLSTTPSTFGAMTGFICETALYNRALNSTEMASWLTYSQGKWATP